MRPTANQLRAARAWLGLSQAQVADYAGLNGCTVAKAEAGQPVQAQSVEAMVGAFKARGLVFIGRNMVHRLQPGELVF
jgi:predicted transcriptional regulator